MVLDLDGLRAVVTTVMNFLVAYCASNFFFG